MAQNTAEFLPENVWRFLAPLYKTDQVYLDEARIASVTLYDILKSIEELIENIEGVGDLNDLINLVDDHTLALTTLDINLTNLGNDLIAGLATKIDKNTLDANSVLAATVDDTPVALSMGPSTILARLAAGNIVAATPAQLRTLLGLAPEPFVTNLAAGTGVVNVVHNLNTVDISAVSVRKVSTGAFWGVGVSVVDANTISLDFDTYVRATDEFRVVVRA